MHVFDIRTIGAGGGSIARAEAGLLKVGPASAGAVPGPACYGAGGTDATVTDAAVVLGLISGEEFLDGRMALDADAATAAVGRVAAGLGLPLADTAAGIIKVAVARTVGSLREITTERGLDPRDFALLAFGGAGPLLGPIVASEMGMPMTVVPRDPALFSAWGMLTTDLEYSVSHGSVIPLEGADAMSEVRKSLAELEATADAVLRDRVAGATPRRAAPAVPAGGRALPGPGVRHHRRRAARRRRGVGLGPVRRGAPAAARPRHPGAHGGGGVPGAGRWPGRETRSCPGGCAARSPGSLPETPGRRLGPASVRPAYDFAVGRP